MILDYPYESNPGIGKRSEAKSGLAPRATQTKYQTKRTELSPADQEGVFNVLQINIKDKNNEELQSNQMARKQTIKIGNSHHKHIMNYDFNSQISMDKTHFE